MGKKNRFQRELQKCKNRLLDAGDFIGEYTDAFLDDIHPGSVINLFFSKRQRQSFRRLPSLISIIGVLVLICSPCAFAETGAAGPGQGSFYGGEAGGTQIVIDASGIFEDSTGTGPVIIEGPQDAGGPEGVEAAPMQAPNELASEKDYISGAHASQITNQLPRFGYSFFRKAPSTFAPVQDVPVDPNYVLGPGDSLRVLLWGMVQGNWVVRVDRNGNVALPQAGVIGVAGLSFGQAQDAIRKAYERYFANFEINVTMGSLRSITVYVVGQVNRPGAYTVSSLSTLVNALMAAGGPSYAGTLRDIQVKRGGRVITHFDAYNLLLKGEKKGDIRLMPGDVIFVPPVANLVGITGDVKVPAYYEFTGQMRLTDLVRLAGGFTSRYFAGRIQVDRTEGHAYRTAFESDLKDLRDLRKNFTLMNGDLVKVFPVSIQVSSVKIQGAVANPGEYAIEPGVTRIRDVLQRAGGPLYMAFHLADLTRLHVTQDGPVTEHLRVDLKKALAGDPSHNLVLDVNDFLMIRNVPDWELYRTISISGEVMHPGTYSLKKGERLSDLIERAGGFTDKAFLKGARFSRASVRATQRKRIEEMVDRLEKSLYSASAEATSTAMNLADAQSSALETQQKQRLLDRLRDTEPDGRIVVRIPDDYRLLKGSPYDLELEEGDSLVIPDEPQTVQVLGAVFSPTAFVYRPGQPFTEYVRQAGNYAQNADRKHVYIIKADGSAIRGYRNNKPVMPENGDAVIVPEKINVKAKLRDTRDIVDIIYKVAISAAVVLD